MGGFSAGAEALAGRLRLRAPPPSAASPRRRRPARRAAAEPTGPDAAAAQGAGPRRPRPGKKLVDQEKWKRAEHPFDAYQRLHERGARQGQPKPEDNFRWRYHGLFYVAPAQDATCAGCASRTASCTHWQFARRRRPRRAARRRLRRRHHARQPADPRDRARRTAAAVLDGLADLGIITAGRGRRQHPQRHRHPDRRHRPAGTDRHPPAAPGDAPLHPQPPRAVRPAAQVQHRLRRRRRDRQRSKTPTTSASRPCEVRRGREPVAPGVYFRLALGGITGHKDFARDTGVLLKPERVRSGSPTRSCACSSSTATAPTARRRG